MIYDKQIIRGKIPSKSNCYKIVALYGHGSLAKQDVLKKYEKNFLRTMWIKGQEYKRFL